MNRHDSLGSRRNPAFDLRRIDVVVFTGVDEDRLGACRHDGSDSSIKCIGCRDHFVAVADPERLQAQEQRICAAADANGVARSAEAGECLFEGVDLGAQREVSPDHDLADLGQDCIVIGELLAKIVVIDLERVGLPILLGKKVSE